MSHARIAERLPQLTVVEVAPTEESKGIVRMVNLAVVQRAIVRLVEIMNAERAAKNSMILSLLGGSAFTCVFGGLAIAYQTVFYAGMALGGFMGTGIGLSWRAQREHINMKCGYSTIAECRERYEILQLMEESGLADTNSNLTLDKVLEALQDKAVLVALQDRINLLTPQVPVSLRELAIPAALENENGNSLSEASMGLRR